MFRAKNRDKKTTRRLELKRETLARLTGGGTWDKTVVWSNPYTDKPKLSLQEGIDCDQHTGEFATCHQDPPDTAVSYCNACEYAP
jgi:hypothetical protein